jgi:hypothetical protein
MPLLSLIPEAAKPGLSNPNATDYTEVTHISRTYDIRVRVKIAAQVVRDYDGYGGPFTSTEECIVSVLCYTLHCEPAATSLPVILSRCVDQRPVQVTLKIERRCEPEECLYLDLTDETEL